jgi:signal transduction histidine kinase/FixJ family two-component response regulator/CHASE3 domain sensor protein
LRIKLVIMLVLAISAVLIVGYISYHGLRSLMATIEENLEPDSREADLESLLHQISEAESNLRIYAITEESRYLRPYYEHVEKADSLLQVLQNKSINELSITRHLDTIQQTLSKKTGIQNRLIRLNQEQERIDVYEEVLYQFQYLEKKNAMFDSLRSAIERAEQTLEKEILEKEKEIHDQGSDFEADTEVQERKGFFRRLFKSDKKPEQKPSVPIPDTDNKLEELDNLMAAKDTLSQIIDTLKSEDISMEIERTLAEIRIRQENINRELVLVELNLTKRDKAYGYQIQRQAAQIHKIFVELDAAQAREASNFFHKITNQITITGSVFAMLFIILVFIVMNDVKINQKYRKALEEAKNNAEKLALAKEDFLSNMSHEIRTPLNAIIGFAEQMDHSELDTQSRGQLSIIQNASRHLLSIINDILDYAKIEAGKIQLDNIPFSIEEHMRLVYDTLYKSATDKKLEFILDFDQSINGRFTMGDPVRYRQILFNLAGNAIKFTEKGFVKIGVELDNGDLIIKVSDSGPGINNDYLDIIFDKFDQAPTSGSNKHKGTGLGLTIVKKLVEMHTGEITVCSEVNVGTEFIVRLPFTPPDDDLQDTNQVRAVNDFVFTQKMQVLIVDDEEYNRKLIETILDKYAISHKSVNSGKEALALFETEEFDLILMDLRMDDLDGFETTKILREQYHTEIPIIAVTATATGDIRENCLKAGMNDVLIKPISEYDLLKILRHSPDQKAGSLNGNHEAIILERETETAPVDKEALLFLFQNDKAMTLDMTRLYHTSMVSAIAGLQEDMEKKDYEAIRKNVHKIIPSSRHMGFTGFASLLKALELDLINESGNRNVVEKLPKILSEATGVVVRLEKFLEELSEK